MIGDTPVSYPNTRSCLTTVLGVFLSRGTQSEYRAKPMSIQNSPRRRVPTEPEFSPDFLEHHPVRPPRLSNPGARVSTSRFETVSTNFPSWDTRQDLPDVQLASAHETARSLVLERFTVQMTLVSFLVILATALVYQGAVGGPSESGYSIAGVVVLGVAATFAVFTRRHLRVNLISLYVQAGADHATATAQAKAELTKILFARDAGRTRL